LVSGEAPASFQCSTSVRLSLPGTTSIVFGENQLSPSLIGLSPLPTVHPNIFQHERVRTSTRHYPSFILTMGRSLRFRVYRHVLLRPCRLAFATAPALKALTSHVTSNSPDHNAKGTQSGKTPKSLPLLPLVGTRFQDLFHSPSGVLFTFPSRYCFTIGHGRVFSLGGWSPQIPTGFLVSRRTQVPELIAYGNHLSPTGLSPSAADPSRSLRLDVPRHDGQLPRPGPTTPERMRPGLGSSPFARRYSGNLV
jgi:hypothetical protein